MISKNKIITDCETLLKKLEDTIYCDHYTNYFSVDVKRHNDYVNIEDLIDNNPTLKPYKNKLLKDYTEEILEEIYFSWLEIEREFIFETLESIAQDSDYFNIVSKYFNKKNIGFAGRSGGHFVIDYDESLIEDLTAIPYDLRENTYKVSEVIEDYKRAKEHAEAILWLLNQVDQYNKGLSFKTELNYRFELMVEDYKLDL